MNVMMLFVVGGLLMLSFYYVDGYAQYYSNNQYLYERASPYSSNVADYWQNQYNFIYDQYRNIYSEYMRMLAVANDERFEADTNTLHKTVIQGTEINWYLQDSKGNSYFWNLPVIAYEDYIHQSRDLSFYNDEYGYLTLENYYGDTFTQINIDGFIGDGHFSDVIDDIYSNSHSDSDFIWEVWHIVSQMTVYDKDVNLSSEGRYALETLTRSGGDCEDLVILIADMLKSSSYTNDWIIQYVYMDSDNPARAIDADHIILYVNDGEYDYYIEATGEPSWDYYPDGVWGWWYDA